MDKAIALMMLNFVVLTMLLLFGIVVVHSLGSYVECQAEVITKGEYSTTTWCKN